LLTDGTRETVVVVVVVVVVLVVVVVVGMLGVCGDAWSHVVGGREVRRGAMNLICCRTDADAVWRRGGAVLVEGKGFGSVWWGRDNLMQAAAATVCGPDAARAVTRRGQEGLSTRVVV
jgi:hypothetical protein